MVRRQVFTRDVLDQPESLRLWNVSAGECVYVAYTYGVAPLCRARYAYVCDMIGGQTHRGGIGA